MYMQNHILLLLNIIYCQTSAPQPTGKTYAQVACASAADAKASPPPTSCIQSRFSLPASSSEGFWLDVTATQWFLSDSDCTSVPSWWTSVHPFLTCLSQSYGLPYSCVPRFLTAVCKCTRDADISQIKAAGERSVSSGNCVIEQEKLT